MIVFSPFYEKKLRTISFAAWIYHMFIEKEQKTTLTKSMFG